MRIAFVLLLLGVLQASAVDAYAQRTRISINFSDTKLASVLDKIEQESEFFFLYNEKLLDTERKVSIVADDKLINVILDELLSGTDAKYAIIDRKIIISPEDMNNIQVENEQQKRISGIVTDKAGTPLPGVNVLISGTTVGQTTDISGKFTIEVKPDSKSLIFSFIGMISKEVPIGESLEINVVLDEAMTGLDEVVVVGYGTQLKRDITGATSTIKADVIASRPITRVDQALQGTTAGVSVGSNNGQPGKPLSVRIRGTNSLTGSNEPLYVIDGYVGGNIETINPEDIESMEVLKDASATAIYGSRGSNGVVLITTKTGIIGKMKVDFNAWVSRASVPVRFDLMNAYDFAKTVNTQYAAKNQPAAFTDAQLDEIKAKGDGTDWQSEISQSPIIQNYQLAMSGGNDKVRYLFSGNYLDQPGLQINQWYKKASMRANIDVKVNDKIDLKFILNASQSKDHNTHFTGGLFNPWALAFQWDPTTPVMTDGQYNFRSQYASIQINPVAEANLVLNDNTYNNYVGTGMFVYRITKNLSFTSNVSYESSYRYNPTLNGPQTSTGSSGKDGASTNNTRYTGFQNSNFLTYKLDIGEHALTVTALYEQQTRESSNVLATSTKLSSYANGFYNLGLGATQQVSSGYWADALQSFMGRVNYSFKSKYLITASLRDDGSSHLTDKYSLFPSLALGWNIGKENFMANSKTISALKLRLSYGKTGNQAVPPYATIPSITVGVPYYYDGTTPSIATSLGTAVSSSLKWETTSQYDAGIDAGFLKDRITFTADVYYKQIDDLLYNYPAPDYLGGGTYPRNIGSLENKGLEFTIGGKPISKSKFQWDSHLVLSFNKNKVLDLGGLDNIQVNAPGATSQQLYLFILKVGEQLGQFRGYNFLGTWKTSEATEAAAWGLKPGDAKYTDLDGDKKLTSADLMDIGNGTPKVTFGWTNDLIYSNFTLSFMFQGSQGNQIFSSAFPYMYGGLGDTKNATHVDAMTMWTAANETDFPIVGSTSNFLNSNRYVYNGSYVKLKNISLSYNFPKSLLNKINMSNLELYVSGQNVLCLTNYPGYDPETTTAQNAITQGLETGSIPNPRTFTIGIKTSF